jgi:hypothetical protein
MSDFDLGSIEVSSATGIDALFKREPQLVRASQVRVASVQDLKPFMRLSEDTLIHKSNRDLWALKKESDGSFVIERLFDDNGQPLKG